MYIIRPCEPLALKDSSGFILKLCLKLCMFACLQQTVPINVKKGGIYSTFAFIIIAFWAALSTWGRLLTCADASLLVLAHVLQMCSKACL